MRGWFLLTFLTQGLLAQSAPEILFLGDSATFTPGITWNSLATLFGENLASREESATLLPLPTELAGVQVFACDRSGCSQEAPLLYVGPTQINFLVPRDWESRTIVVSRNGVRSEPYTEERPAEWGGLARFRGEAIFLMGRECPIGGPSCADEGKLQRGAITAQDGSLISSANPMRPDRWYTVWFTNLGNRDEWTPGTVRDYRNVSTRARIWTDDYTEVPDPPIRSGEGIDGESIAYSGTSPEFPGLYQMTFRLNRVALGDMFVGCSDRDVDLWFSFFTHAGPPSNAVAIPVRISAEETPCVGFEF